MIEFLRVQYARGRVTAEQLQKLVGVKISEEQYRLIEKEAV